MKRVLTICALAAVCAAVVFTVLFVAHPEKSPAAAAEKKLRIVTTIFPQYDFAKQITGEDAEVVMLLKPGAESHSYEPTPKDIKTIRDADLFIYVGGENDVWVEDILASMGEARPATLKLLDCVETLDEELVEGMESDHEHGEHAHDEHAEAEAGHDDHDEHEHEVDEHVWTSPKNAIAIVQAITAVLEQKDPARAEQYRANSNAYQAELAKLDASFREITASAANKTILFADRFPFRYFAEEYGLTYYAAFSGCSTETEASAATVAFLINKVREERLPVVFTIELSNGKIADSVSEATGARKLQLHSCHTVTADQLRAGETYLSLMTQNEETLRAALR